MGFAVYFSAKEESEQKVHLAVIVYEGMTSFPPIEKKIENRFGSSNYEHHIEAFLLALETVELEGYDDVTIFNQNKLIFDWIKQKEHTSEMRTAYYKEINNKIKELIEDGVEIICKVVPGGKNEAERYLKKKRKKKKSESSTFDMNELFNSKTRV